MTKYEEIIGLHSDDSDGGLALENAINEAYSQRVTDLLEYDGHEVQGIISIHQDYSIPYLWHIVDHTHYHNLTVDYVFNGKTEKIINKYEEVC